MRHQERGAACSVLHRLVGDGDEGLLGNHIDRDDVTEQLPPAGEIFEDAHAHQETDTL